MAIDSKILLKGDFGPKDVEIVVREDSIWQIDTEFENRIQKIWAKIYQDAKEKGKLIFEATHYRLDKVLSENNRLILELGTIKFSQRFCFSKLTGHESFKYEMQPRAIGIGALLLSLDGYYVFGERDLGQQIYHKGDEIALIGGGLVKDEIQVKDSTDLWTVLYKEIHEESGVRVNDIVSTLLKGIIITTSGNVLFLFHVNLKLNKAEVKKRVSSREDKEMVGLDFVRADRLEKYLNKLGGFKPQLAKLMH